MKITKTRLMQIVEEELKEGWWPFGGDKKEKEAEPNALQPFVDMFKGREGSLNLEKNPFIVSAKILIDAGNEKALRQLQRYISNVWSTDPGKDMSARQLYKNLTSAVPELKKVLPATEDDALYAAFKKIKEPPKQKQKDPRMYQRRGKQKFARRAMRAGALGVMERSKLKQIIKEELARLTEADWDHPPEPAGSLGGYGDSDDLYADPNPPPVETSIHQDFADLQMGMRNPYTPWEMLSGGGRMSRLEAALANNPGLEERLRKAANDIRAPGARSHRDLKAIGNAFFEELSAAIEKEYA